MNGRERSRARPARRVAVIGAGWAGLAAAVTLAEGGAQVTVIEASRFLGGRARRVELDGIALDNGQHILIGAYTETLRLMRLVGVDPDRALSRLPLELRTADGFRLKAVALPAPLHLLGGLLMAKGLDLRERLLAAQLVARLHRDRYRLASDETVAALLARHGQTGKLRASLWDPLCVSALNTPAERASAQVFANVLRDTFSGGRAASDLLLPRTDLGTLFPEPAANWLATCGGEILLAAPVRGVQRSERAFVLNGGGSARMYDRVIIACAPRHAAALLVGHERLTLLAAQLEALAFEPIHTVYLRYPERVSLPFPMLGFTGGLLQWAFDRGALTGERGLVAGVLSASGRHEALSHPDLAAAIHAELAAHLPLPSPSWTRVIAERRATFSCTPGLERPAAETPLPGLLLAGDYTEGDYPATLESAVRSGVAAARLAMEHG